VASIAVGAQVELGSVSGVVVDPSGARVPNARVTAEHQGGTNKETTRSNTAGEYQLKAIPGGQYVFEFASPGFAPKKVDAVVKAGEAARVDATLDIVSASEAVTVTGHTSLLPSRSATRPRQQITLGGNVRPAKVMDQVKPDYPADLQRLGVQGSVMIRAVISINGNVLSPQVVSTGADARLAKLALNAVRQWRYEPCLLNGQPVETATTVTIDFALDSAIQ
jgi:TonB family protein